VTGTNQVISELVGEVSTEVERRSDDIVALVRELVSYRSENPKLLADPDHQEEGRAQEAACQDAIAAHLRAAGLEVDSFEALPGREDIVGTLRGGGGGPSLILNGHVDVVPAGERELWPCDPWSGAVADGKIWGRGTCDMKGGLAAGIAAFWTLATLGLRPRGDVVFQAVVDEETGGPGTREAVARHPADAAIVLEPSAGALVPVEGGL
jgi:acetylornithine deacetylase